MPRNEDWRMRHITWINRTVIGILLAAFLSDVSHEMCTAVLPVYRATLNLGPAARGVIEGVADFLVSLSKLAGGIVGHRVPRKRPWAALGYLTTTLATRAMALVAGLATLVPLRGLAWTGRGSAGPCGTTYWRMRSSPRITGVPMGWSGVEP